MMDSTTRSNLVLFFLMCPWAFDSVWHYGRMYKLIRLQMPDTLIHFINSYLEHRSFSVCYAHQLSTQWAISARVPQSSKLGPILFNIYIEIPRSPHTTLTLYADDTAILACTTNIWYMYKHLEKHLEFLEPWFEKWHIKITTEKSNTIFFPRKCVPPSPIEIFGHPVRFDLQRKYLRLLDSHLTFKLHFRLALQ